MGFPLISLRKIGEFTEFTKVFLGFPRVFTNLTKVIP